MAQPARKGPALNTARLMAVWLLNGVVVEQKALSELTTSEKFLELAPEDRARATRLATTTLRHAGRADKALKAHLPKRPPEAVQNILRLGVVEVLGQGAPIHAVINDLVSICAAASRTRPLKGLVNAVLRKAIADLDGKWNKSPVPMLPRWLRKPLTQAYGNGPMMLIETAHMKGAPVDLTVKSDVAGWAEKLGATVLPNGSLRLATGTQISKMDGFAEGAWWVQDTAATVAADWVKPLEGEKIADLCAAPGGKTLQLANAGANVTAIDLSAVRLERVQENLDRTQLKAKVIAADILDYKQDGFDAVLLDAPCSATGTIRRHPDLPFIKDGTGISELIELQAKMLAHAATLVKPGGRLVFCTCSLIPDEGEVQVEEFLAAHAEFTADTTLPAGMQDEWRTSEGGLRLRPDYWADQGGMDGFYIARLNRAG